MIIDDFFRDEQNEVWAICGDQKIHLDAAYIVANKPQIGDEIAQAEPVEVELIVEQPVEQLKIEDVEPKK